MLVLITLIISVIFVMLCSGTLKKHPIAFYTAGAFVTVSLILLNIQHINEIPEFISKWIMPVFTKGMSAAVLWFIVAVTGALPNGSALIKRLMPVRGELSVFSAIITMSHAVTYGIVYIRRLSSGNTNADFIISFLICLILMIIMIPLTVMSFKMIRRKMNAGTWKSIQKFAYLFYTLIYAHVFVIYLQKRNIDSDAVLSMILYSMMFFGYAYLRIRKYLIIRKKADNKTALNTAAVVPVFLTVLFTGMISRTHQSVIPQTKSFNTQTDHVQITERTTKEYSEIQTEPASKSVSMSVTTAETEAVTEPASETITQNTVSEITDKAETENDFSANSSEEDQKQEYTDDHEKLTAPSQEQTEETQSQPEPVYIHQNGTFTASAYGYDGDITVTITIENDVITDIYGYSEESDIWYFDSAFETVKNRILSLQNTSVDAVSGATYSSGAIMQAVEKALASAEKEGIR